MSSKMVTYAESFHVICCSVGFDGFSPKLVSVGIWWLNHQLYTMKKHIRQKEKTETRIQRTVHRIAGKYENIFAA